MAVRITKYGGQSYDPEAELKKKLGVTGGASTPPPIIPPTVTPQNSASAEKIAALPTLQERLVAAGVAPRQGKMMPAGVSQQLAATYAAETATTGMQKRIENVATLSPEQINAAMGFNPQPQNSEVGGIPQPVATFDPNNPWGTAPSAEQLAQGMGQVVTETANAYDILQSLISFSGRELLTISTAETSLTLAMASLGSEIDMAKSGLKSPRDVQADFIKAENSINELERREKEFGTRSKRHWIDSGKAIQTEILVNRQKLNNMKRELLATMIQRGAI